MEKHSINSENFKKLDKKVIWAFFFNFSLVPIIILVIGLFPIFLALIDDSLIELTGFFIFSLFILFGGCLVFCYVWARLTYHYYRYELTDTSFYVEKGIIFKNYKTLSYDRIQNVEIERGILDRIFGLSSLVVLTAGLGGQYLPGLSREIAEQLRDELVVRARRSGNNISE